MKYANQFTNTEENMILINSSKMPFQLLLEKENRRCQYKEISKLKIYKVLYQNVTSSQSISVMFLCTKHLSAFICFYIPYLKWIDDIFPISNEYMFNFLYYDLFYSRFKSYLLFIIYICHKCTHVCFKLNTVRLCYKMC